MNSQTPHALIKVQERTFLLAVILQALVALGSLLVALLIWQVMHQRSALSSVRSTFARFEPAITESVYIQEISNQSPALDSKPLRDFEIQLRLNDINVKTSLGSCLNDGPELVLPLYVGDRKLLSCVRANLGSIASGKTVWTLMALSILSFLLSWSVWLGVRKLIAGRVVQPLIDQIEASARARALSELTTQVLHDIQSPLAALAMVEKELDRPSPDTQAIASAAIQRIQGIVRTLLAKNRAEAPRPVRIGEIIETIVNEYRFRFREDPEVAINWNSPEAARGLQAEVPSVELTRVLSNLMTNAVEACDSGPKHVEISLRPAGSDRLAITIRDNGRGVPPDLLRKLGPRGITYGKVEGSGLGLSHAISTVDGWQGKLTIESPPGQGTIVTIILPRILPSP